VVAKVAEVADRRGLSRAQVAMAWLLAQPAVTSPIVGVTRLEHLTPGGGGVELSDSEVGELAAEYVPHAIAGHQ